MDARIFSRKSYKVGVGEGGQMAAVHRPVVYGSSLVISSWPGLNQLSWRWLLQLLGG